MPAPRAMRINSVRYPKKRVEPIIVQSLDG
jgi:hypothetical protein